MAKNSKEIDDVEELVMIDAIQRLGLECYFRDHIRVALEKHYARYNAMIEDCDSLHDAALCFRLLRQEGYYVSADSLGKFMDKDGKFKEELANDIKGLLSLFEASKPSIPSDIILDDAKKFSGKFLKASLNNIERYEAKLVENTLRYPFHQSLPRLMAKKFLPNLTTFLEFGHGCNHMSGWINEVQDLAKIDINMAHLTKQDEITQVSRWWNELQLAKESKVTRYKPVIWHTWSLALLPNPDMAEQRIQLTKPISLIYIIDDLFDSCATLEDFMLFTEAVNKWECTNLEKLPDYMKLCLETLHDITNETCYKLYVKHGWNPKDSLKKAWADLCNAFLVEARWFASGYLPTTKEHLQNGIVSSGVAIMFIYVFSILGENSNHKTTDDLFTTNNYPDIVTSTAIIFRLWNGLGGAKDENHEAHDGSFIACYMNEYKGSSYESAQQHALRKISDTWKCLNKECLSNSPFSADFKTACLNMARMIPVMYDYEFTY